MNLADVQYIAAGLAGWTVAQGFKYALNLHKDGFSFSDLFSSGGMPSSHSAFVSAPAMLIGLNEGFNSAVFALAFMIAGVVFYDAVGVRKATGENTLAIRDLQKASKTKGHRPNLELSRGHTPLEVVGGATIGVLVGVFISLMVG